jgi:hypothetical protein
MKYHIKVPSKLVAPRRTRARITRPGHADCVDVTIAAGMAINLGLAAVRNQEIFMSRLNESLPQGEDITARYVNCHTLKMQFKLEEDDGIIIFFNGKDVARDSYYRIIAKIDDIPYCYDSFNENIRAYNDAIRRICPEFFRTIFCEYSSHIRGMCGRVWQHEDLF